MYRSKRGGTASWATTRGGGAPRSRASASYRSTPNTWSMCPCVNTAVCNGSGRHSRTTSWTRPARNGLLVSTRTIPSGVEKAATFENAATNALSPPRSARAPPMPNRWRWSMSASPRHSRSAMSSRSVAIARSLARRGLECLPAGIGTCFTLAVTTPATSDSPAPDTALARSQAARRRRVLDAALRLAERGGFDAVQMRDVATEANVALGTVYRYFTSKERLLLEAMVEEIEALAARLEARRPRRRGAVPGDGIAAAPSGGDGGDGAGVRHRRRGRCRAAGRRDHDRHHHGRDARGPAEAPRPRGRPHAAAGVAVGADRVGRRGRRPAARHRGSPGRHRAPTRRYLIAVAARADERAASAGTRSWSGARWSPRTCSISRARPGRRSCCARRGSRTPRARGCRDVWRRSGAGAGRRSSTSPCPTR